MINKIKFHNYVYGFIFSLVEFILFELILLPFMFYYFAVGRLLFGITTLGIVLNALPIIVWAIVSLIKKEKDIGIRSFLKKDTRNKTYAKYPHLQRDTNQLAALLLIPFLLILLCLADLIKNRKF